MQNTRSFKMNFFSVWAISKPCIKYITHNKKMKYSDKNEGRCIHINICIKCIFILHFKKNPKKNLEEICMHDECNASIGLYLIQYKNTHFISGPNPLGAVASERQNTDTRHNCLVHTSTVRLKSDLPLASTSLPFDNTVLSEPSAPQSVSCFDSLTQPHGFPNI